MTLLSNSIMVSFDVSNLFTCVPVNEALKEVKKFLDNSEAATELLRLMQLCTSQNYFSFDDKLYRMNEGLAMGCPLSPLLADIFMNSWERKLFNQL